MFLIFDIGGTKTRIGFSVDKKTFLPEKVRIIPTEKSFLDGTDRISAIGHDLADGLPIKSIVGSIAAPLDGAKRSILDDAGKPTLTDWIDKDLIKRLSAIFDGAPVKLENDSAMGALGEAVFGAGKGFSIVAFLNIGTGVGGARIVDEKIDLNVSGFEPGRQIIDVDGSIFPFANPPISLEDVLGGHEIRKRTGKNPSEIDDPHFWLDMAYYLAVGLNNVIAYWSPDVIVIGGSISKIMPLEHSREMLAKITGLHMVPPLKRAQLGDLVGLYGGLAYLKNNS